MLQLNLSSVKLVSMHGETHSVNRAQGKSVRLAHDSEDESYAGQVTEMLINAARPQLGLIAPMLEQLNNSNQERWLSVVCNQADQQRINKWIASLKLQFDRVLFIRTKDDQEAFRVCTKALESGTSHSVISWLELNQSKRRALKQAASSGHCQCINIFAQ